jgi:hypothetical protein
VRPRTIILTAGGVLVVGMLVFLALEVSRDSSASGGGGDDKPAADDSGAHKRAPGVSAQHSLPMPRHGRPGAAGDHADSSAEENSSGGPAAERTPPPKAPFPRVAVPAVGLPAEGLSERPTTSNGDPESDEKMAAATDAYDKGDYQAAQERALTLLETSPRNIKALRIAVSTSCMFGEMDRARELNARLPKSQQEQMRRRCKKNGGDL